MSSSHKLLLGLLVVLLAALGLGWKLLGGESGPRRPVLEYGGMLPEPSDDAPSIEKSGTDLSEIAPIPERADYDLVHPLKIELELVRAAAALTAEGAQDQGHGARSKLRGHVYGADGKGAAGELVFVAGANRGRVLDTDAAGSFGANDLFPGLSIVAVESPGNPPAMREVLLRNARDSELNVGFGRLATVYGEVIDTEGKPLPYATVTMDGQKATTDEDGVFYFPRMASGQVLAIIQKPGFAAYRELLNISANRTIEIGRIKFALEKAATLKVTVQERVGAPGDALLFLEPAHDYKNPGMMRQRKYPWHLASPISITPGATVTIEDLPAMRVRLRLVHAGARAVPAVTSVDLVSDRTKHQVLHLEPAEKLRGLVTKDGEPVHRAKVTLEVPDVAIGTAEILGGPIGLLEADVSTMLPPALQVTYTSALGEFELSTAEELGALRYLTAVGPDGEGWAGRVVSGGDRQVELALERRVEHEVSLRIDSEERKRVMPLEVRIDGAPLDKPYVLPDEELVVPGLVPGVWRVSATYRGKDILQPREMTFEGDEASLLLRLPIELREGPQTVAGS